MKAIVVGRHGGPEVLKLEESERPVPGPGQALIRNGAIGVNFIDVYFRTGLYAGNPPYTPGQEGAGVIEALGEGAGGDVRIGQRVAYAAGAGSYAQYTLAPADKLVPVPDGIDDATACVAMVQGMTAHYLSHSTFPIASGDSVIVHAAAGGVGALLVQMAKRRGGHVIATVSTDAKAQLARDAGADEVINYVEHDFEAETHRISGGLGVHCVYDSVGKDTWEKSLGCLRPRGYLVCFGQSSGSVPPIDPQYLSRKGSVFFTRPTLLHYTRTRGELLARATAVFDSVLAGELKVNVGTTYPLAEAERAHRDLEARKSTGKLILTP